MERSRMAAWGLCVLLVAVAGVFHAFALDGYVESDALDYWERRLYGVRLSPSVCAMASPLSSCETSQLASKIARGTGGRFLRLHAPAFCKAAHVQCKLDSLQVEVGESLEEGRSSRVLTSSRPQVIIGDAFRAEEVLVAGAEIHENHAGYEGDAEAAAQAFLPGKLAKLFPLEGEAKNVKQLGVTDEDLQQLLPQCEVNKELNELKKCVTSIEDLADFVASEMRATPDANIVMHDSITDGGHVDWHEAGDTLRVLHVKRLTTDSEPFVACHDVNFPLRVFLCHYLTRSKPYQVVLQGENGSIHERVAVCHYGAERPENKPGDEAEVCHWLGGMSLRPTGFVFVRGAGTP